MNGFSTAFGSNSAAVRAREPFYVRPDLRVEDLNLLFYPIGIILRQITRKLQLHDPYFGTDFSRANSVRASSIFERCDNSSGLCCPIFQQRSPTRHVEVRPFRAQRTQERPKRCLFLCRFLCREGFERRGWLNRLPNRRERSQLVLCLHSFAYIIRLKSKRRGG